MFTVLIGSLHTFSPRHDESFQFYQKTCHRHFIYPHASFDEIYHVKNISCVFFYRSQDEKKKQENNDKQKFPIRIHARLSLFK